MNFFDDDDDVPSRPADTGGGNGGNRDNNRGDNGYSGGRSDSRDGGSSGYNQNRSGGSGGGYNRGGGGGGKKFERKPEEPGYVYLPYVVTGDKNVPQAVVEKVAKYIRRLSEMGYVMRTGGHTEFENAIEGFSPKDKTEVYIPFKGFEDRDSKFSYTGTFVKDVAGMYHSSWDTLSKGAQTFFAKNVKMLCGTNGKSRAMFAIVWTEDGVERTEEVVTRHGQVGHFIKVANGYRIPVFNFGRPDAEERLQRFLTANP